jgi:hypothetical protein
MTQWLIDFCEMRMHHASEVAYKRSRKYGDTPWPWRIAIWQEIFWTKLMHKL